MAARMLTVSNLKTIRTTGQEPRQFNDPIPLGSLRNIQFQILIIRALKHAFAVAIVALILTSCESVVDLDLNSSAPRIMIEGNITMRLDPIRCN